MRVEVRSLRLRNGGRAASTSVEDSKPGEAAEKGKKRPGQAWEKLGWAGGLTTLFS